MKKLIFALSFIFLISSLPAINILSANVVPNTEFQKPNPPPKPPKTPKPKGPKPPKPAPKTKHPPKPPRI